MNYNKKILILTRNFPPLTGGMEKLLFNVYLELNKEYECNVIGPQGAKEYMKNPEYSYEINSKSPILFFFISGVKSFFICNKIKPDIIIGGSGIVAPIVALLSKILSIKSVLFLHGLDIIAKNKIYQMLFVPSMRHIDKIIVNSRNTKSLAISAKINPNRITIIHPGVQTNIILSNHINIRKIYNIDEGPTLLSVGRITPRKGIANFIEKSLPSIKEKVVNVKLIIIGDEAKDAVNFDSKELNKISNAIEKHNLSNNVIFLGKVSDDILHQFFSIADVLIFPLVPVNGDVEGFGMVAIEAASFGVPTIAFNEGGVNDAINDGVSGYLIQSQDYNSFTKKVIEVLMQKDKFNKEECNKFSAQFSWSIFGTKLRKIIKNIPA